MIQKIDFPFSPCPDETRKLHIYLPDEYYSTDERYPVVYMFDGHNLFDDADATYGKSWGLKDYLDHWHKRLIIVGMECNHRGNERLFEYCPYTIHSRMFGGTIEGRGVATMEWIVNEVKPYIDSHFRTWWHREATAVGGSSMGGMMALFAVLRYNNIFSKAAAISPAIFDAEDDFLKEFDATPSRPHPIHPDTRVYFGWGALEDRRGWTSRHLEHIDSFLRKRGARTALYRAPKGRHDEASWQLLIPRFMPFLWE